MKHLTIQRLNKLSDIEAAGVLAAKELEAETLIQRGVSANDRAAGQRQLKRLARLRNALGFAK